MSPKLHSFFLLLFILSVFVNPEQAFCQSVGINTTGAAPDASSALDVSASNKGVLIPRVALTATNAAAPVTSPAASLLVYNTATAGTAPNNVLPGYYYWTGSSWQRLLTEMGAVSSGWGLTGNSGTNPGTNFLGTTDNQPLAFKINGQLSGLISSDLGSNLHLGYQTLFYNTTGTSNSAIGFRALSSNTTGTSNSALGYQALYNNTTGDGNSSVGAMSLYSNTVGAYNSALGITALYSNTSGIENSAVGYQALFSNTTGNSNSALGNLALTKNSTGTANTAIGTHALRFNTIGANNAALGFAALYSNTSGNLNTAVGTLALYYNTTGEENSALGFGALNSNFTGNGNTATGSAALHNNTFGNYNSAMGSSALFNNKTGSYNTAMGTDVLFRNTTGTNNSTLGYQALFNNTTGNYNSALGYKVLYSLSSGTYNTALGYEAMLYNTTGSNNAALGKNALRHNTIGTFNTALGDDSGPTAENLTNTSALGATAAPTTSNQVRIGNNSITSITGQVAFSITSDQRFKVAVQEDVKGLDFILKLRPVTYHWDIDSLNRFIYGKAADTLFADSVALAGIATQESIAYTGFLAQEVEAAAKSANYNFSGVVAPANERTPYSIRYAEFVVPLVKAVQEQQSQLGQQNELLVGLSSRINRPVVRLSSAQEWADRVFEPGYQLRPLKEVERFMQQHKHLPGIPSAQELAEKGVDVTSMLSKQMEKIEELTMYVLGLEKKNQKQEAENELIRQMVLDLRKEMREQRALK